ncbi:MAG: hypothetical protein WA005_14455 [Candidatus Binataceae bacterium]
MLKFRSRPWIIGLLICGLAMPVWARGNEMSLDDAIRGYEATTHQTFRGVPDDWSHHHVVFSRPEPGSDTEYKLQQDGRYWLQQIRRSGLLESDQSSESEAAGRLPTRRVPPRGTPPRVTRRRANLGTDWSESLGSATAKVGAGQYPAKFSFTTTGTPSCTDYVLFNTGVAGSTTQPTILAFDNLYATTCGATVPAVYWAYNTGTGATAVTSPVLSPDGSQIAFIQSSSGVASLVLLRWKASNGTLAAPVAPTSETAAGYPGCTAPCMTTIAFGDSHNDTNSFPFYDYSGGDLLFAGDNSGDLHKFQHVFNGTASTPPAEVTTGGFPAAVSAAGEALTAPVYDANSQLAFVAEAHTSGSTTDGKFHSVSSAGTVTSSGPSAAALCHGTGFLDGPVLDPSAGTSGTLYIGCGDDDGGGNCTTSDACIRQFPESLSGSVGTGEPIGATADAEIFAGAFDHTYLTSTSSSSPTGNFYVCGNPGGDPTLYRVPITGNVIGTPVGLTTTTLSSVSGTACSPVTQFYNTAAATDWLFVSVAAAGNETTTACHGTGAANACVYSFNATTALGAGATATAGLASDSGSSGIIVDNASSTTGASNVYFSTLGSQTCTTSGGTDGCAIQAAQSGL